MINWPENIKLKENKYSRWYSLLIEKARARKLPKETYTEGHHVIPKSWGGPNTRDNIVRLTAKEHYIAHAFLWKMDVSIGYHNKMVHAFNAMSIMKDGSYNKPGYKINSRLFESVRLERIAYLKTLKGPLSPAWGKKLNISEEGKQRAREARAAMWNDPERKLEILKNREIANRRPEVIANRMTAADARRGVKRIPAHTEKMREVSSARKGKSWEELYTTEQIARMHEARKNRVLSEEAKSKMWFKGKGKGIAKVKHPCLHCGKMCAGNMLAKWHGDNCKHKLVDSN